MLRRLTWSLRIRWRAIRGHLRPFHDAPLDVVQAWALRDVEDFAGWPELQDAIGLAQGELEQRQHTWRDAPKDTP